MKKWLKNILAVFISLLLIAPAVNAANFPDKPPETDFFVDQASLLQPEHAEELNQISDALLKEENIPLFVVTIPSLSTYGASGLGIEKYAQRLFDHWGIGYQERNYGMLLLVSVGDRKARIEFGADFANQYDREATDIMQNLIVPAFKRGDFSTGIIDGARGLNALGRGLQLPKPTPPAWFWPTLILGSILLVFMIVNLFKTGRSGWAWALIAFVGIMLFFILRNAASSGSSGGFGGGSSGGGGATGSW